jgi:hypothetical protein
MTREEFDEFVPDINKLVIKIDQQMKKFLADKAAGKELKDSGVSFICTLLTMILQRLLIIETSLFLDSYQRDGILGVKEEMYRVADGLKLFEGNENNP